MSRSLRFWLSFGLSSLVAAAVLVAAGVVVGYLVPRLNSEVENQNRALGVAVATQVDDYLDRFSRQMETLAEEIAAADPASARQMLDAIAQTDDATESIYLLNDSLRATDVGLPREKRAARGDYLGVDFSGRGFVVAAHKHRQPVWSDTYLPAGGSIAVAFAVPLPAPLSGVLVGEFNLSEISRFTQVLGRSGEFLPIVLDHHSHIIGHPDPARALRQENLGQLALLRAPAHPPPTGRIRLDGIDYLGSITPLQQTSWKVLVAQPSAKAYAIVESTLRSLALASLLAILLAIIVALFTSRRMARKVAQFAAHLEAVADGNYRARIPRSGTDEIESLAQSMRRMSAAVLEREAQLRAGEAKYRSVVEGSRDLITRVDAEGRLTFVNHMAEFYFGLPPEDCIGRLAFDFVHPDDRESTRRSFADWLTIGSPSLQFENRQVSLKGDVMLVQWSIVPEHGDAAANGHGHLPVTGFSSIGRDVTAERAAAAVMALQSERATALLELPQAAEQLDEKAFMARALDIAERLTGSQISFVHFVNDDQESIELVAWSERTLENFCHAISETHYPISQAGIWAEAFHRRHPVVVNDYPNHPERRGLPEGHSPLMRLLTVPVLADGQVRMLAGVGNKAEAYTPLDIESLQLVSQEVWRLIQDRRAQAAQRLAATVFSASAEGICITDAERRILSVNPALVEITGYSAAELIGQTPRVFSSGRQDADFYRRMWAEINDKGYWRGEIWNKRKNGEVYPEWLTVTAVRDPAGAITHYAGSFFDISDRKRTEQHIEFLAHHDALTRLPNRTLLDDRLRQAIAKSRRSGMFAAVMFLDLDRFKLINDTLGHDVGDRLLEHIATRLTSVLRETETVARLGGDEFVIVIPEVIDADRVAFVANKILEVVAHPQAIEGRQLHVTPSMGIAMYPDDGEDGSTLLRNADTAMYHAKEQGRNNFKFYAPAMNLAVQERVMIENDLRRALAQGEFMLYYQPQVDCRSGIVTGMEALIRWRHPERGLVPPDRFIPIAEETGLIVPIGEWVLGEACRQSRRWADQGRGELRMGVNLSARQFQQPDLQQRVAAAIEAAGVAPESLELELTESMLMVDPESASATLQAFAGMGVRLAIDDFGTGYSSLAYLKRFPVSRLKIDRSFVRDLATDPNDAAIVSAVVAMAGSLRMEVIAEGVETATQLNYLEAHGCHAIQGYYFSRPLPAEQHTCFSYPRTLQ